MHCGVAVGLLILAIMFVILAGFADAPGRDRVFGVSKYHLWADGIFALCLSTWALVYNSGCAAKKAAF